MVNAKLTKYDILALIIFDADVLTCIYPKNTFGTRVENIYLNTRFILLLGQGCQFVANIII